MEHTHVAAVDEAVSLGRHVSGPRRSSGSSAAPMGAHARLLGLQRLAGNRATTSVVQRLDDDWDAPTRDRRGAEDDETWATTHAPPGKPEKPQHLSAAVRLGTFGPVANEEFRQKNAVRLADEIQEGPKARTATPQSRNRAAKFLLIAHQAQDKVTRDVERAMTPGGRREGAEFVNKDWKGLAEKMALEEPGKGDADFLGSVGDALRFTVMFGLEGFTDKVLAAFSTLQALGYRPVKVSNTFKVRDAPYRGINTNWRAGNGIKWELQFHTDQSYNAKTHVNHGPYEGYRNAQDTDPRRGLLKSQMKAVSSRIDTPEGIERIESV